MWQSLTIWEMFVTHLTISSQEGLGRKYMSSYLRCQWQYSYIIYPIICCVCVLNSQAITTLNIWPVITISPQHSDQNRTLWSGFVYSIRDYTSMLFVSEWYQCRRSEGGRMLQHVFSPCALLHQYSNETSRARISWHALRISTSRHASLARCGDDASQLRLLSSALLPLPSFSLFFSLCLRRKLGGECFGKVACAVRASPARSCLTCSVYPFCTPAWISLPDGTYCFTLHTENIRVNNTHKYCLELTRMSLLACVLKTHQRTRKINHRKYA